MTVSAPYQVIVVEPSWASDVEALGSKKKFWYRETRDSANWLFKYPQADTGQHWAEKVAAEVAERLGTFHAKVELAVIGGERGTASESFARDGRELFHGNQILAGTLSGYNPTLRYNQSSHTLSNIFVGLERTFLETKGHWAKPLMAEYLVLDALIGNTDRHHENWGLLRRRVGGQWKGMMAPTFDHASSLGREFRDTGPGKSRERMLIGGLAAYAERGRGGVYWSSTDRYGPSPLQLVRLAMSQYRSIFEPALKKLERIDRDSLSEIIGRLPDDWASTTARVFALELMCYNLRELRILSR